MKRSSEVVSFYFFLTTIFSCLDSFPINLHKTNSNKPDIFSFPMKKKKRQNKYFTFTFYFYRNYKSAIILIFSHVYPNSLYIFKVLFILWIDSFSELPRTWLVTNIIFSTVEAYYPLHNYAHIH